MISETIWRTPALIGITRCFPNAVFSPPVIVQASRSTSADFMSRNFMSLQSV